ncbi:SUMO-activating enzyme subunit 1-like [Neolamprologus brichardi]|uniref:SUMO-activating enzyme subunit 1-like n=1 Tax=Neolamprologus brichardi TaxID=32507 RepID=UPI001643C29E|nr:SUMO-activating enzyme subunit 1-like [Neolamprologus brichardi]
MVEAYRQLNGLNFFPASQLSFLSSRLLLAAVLLKFRTDKGRDPDPQSFPEDSQLLRQIRDDVLESLSLNSDLLNDDFISYCFSEMSPVCAVVGGVLGQEVVKALSQRDAPHRNFFFFDGRKGNGVVDYFGPN